MFNDVSVSFTFQTKTLWEKNRLNLEFGNELDYDSEDLFLLNCKQDAIV